jgi:hypothetical protein
VAAAALLALASGAPAVGAQGDSGEHPTFDRSPGEGPPGTVVKVWGGGCIYYGKPWEYASVYISSAAKKENGTSQYFEISGRFPVKNDGSWEGTFTVSTGAPLGDHTLSASCSASDMTLQAGKLPFVVTEVAPPASEPPAPTTTVEPEPEPEPAPVSARPRPRPRPVAEAPTSTSTTATTPSPTTASPASPLGPPVDLAAASTGDRPGRDVGPWAAAAALALVGVLAAGSTVRRGRENSKHFRLNP